MMSLKKTPSILFALFLLTTVCHQLAAQTFNIKDYGAVGDGKTDNLKAFQRCAQELVKKGGTLIIPYGVYYTSSTIHINYIEGNELIIRGEKNNQGQLPQIKSNALLDVFFINGYYTDPKGTVRVENIAVLGNNQAYSAKHPFYNKPAFQTAFRIVDKNQVYVRNCEISNVYGNGLYIGSSNTQGTPLNKRMQYCELSGNRITNTWGAHLSSGNAMNDDYGDGIYVTNVRKGLIKDNQVVNNLAQTKQFGRSGIVLEYDTENITVENNTVSGYDRNIHIELAIGNNIIRNNKLTGSDYGICVWNACGKGLKPTQIVNNYISNEGVPKGLSLKTIRHASERSLIYIGQDGNCDAATVISNNQLLITNQSGIVSKRGLFVPGSVKVQENQYKSQGLSFFSRPQNRIGGQVRSFQ